MTSFFRHSSSKLIVSTLALATGLGLFSTASAQISVTEKNRPLKLAADSPYHDPDIIYLEADELINDAGGKVLTAVGEVEGRYQDRTLRADRVVYNLENGRVVASGNVILIDSNGSSQYADKLELSNELSAGAAANFTSRFENGGTIGAAFASRNTEDGVELYNAYYTACQPCQDEKPTWQLKARRVSQDLENNMIRYKDAVFQFKGVPVFYSPYLAHPDPTVGRQSGWLAPFAGYSSSKGAFARTPYFWALDDYTDVTLTPRFFTKINPVLGLEARRLFHSGEVNIKGSITYGSAFDRNGDPFTDPSLFNIPELAPTGKRLRSHIDANGLFKLSDDWDWGFTVQGASDDLYINRNDFDENLPKFGLHDGDSRRLVSQIFAVGQDTNFRYAASAYGFQSLRTIILNEEENPEQFLISAEDDSTLPIVAPSIEINRFFNDPILGGRVEASGDLAVLTRNVGTNYTRGSGGLNWEKTLILPAGIEARPFAGARIDQFNYELDDGTKLDFGRTLGTVGADIRWPFLRAGDGLDIIVEPRVLVTQNFGDGKIGEFTAVDDSGQTVSLFQDSLDIDLDKSLFWSENKSTGYDFWQKGFRADVGGSVSALWGENYANLFVGQSFARDYDDDFGVVTGLSGDSSDIVGQAEIGLGKSLSFNTRLRYDDDDNKFRRIDTGFRYTGSRIKTDLRYYKIDSSVSDLLAETDAPAQELSGGVEFKLTDQWSARYRATRDLDEDINRRQQMALVFQDGCTLVEFVYDEQNFPNDAVRDSSGFAVRFSLLTLGQFEQE